jgi:glucose/arabinose dehydrogenase
MRLSVGGWAAVVSLVVLGLAGWVIRRSFVDTLSGNTATANALQPAAPGAGEAAAPAAPARVRFVPVAVGFAGPVDLQFIPGSAKDAIVLEKGGRARLVSLPDGAATGTTAAGGAAAAVAPAEPGPDVFTVEVESESELGLLGLAFHPRYAENGLFYTNTNPKGTPLRTSISEWSWRPDMAGKQPAEKKRVLLEIEQPFKNHDGGCVAFGPDGYLYIGMGDGGSRADPHNAGQDLNNLLGKMLRIDVNAAPPYGIPADNPFVNKPGVKPEIWAWGLRNPWRFTWDPKGRLIAADVGQDSYEEVDIVTAGANMGWRQREAKHCFNPKEGCQTENMVDPIFEYGREQGQSITGGQIYLGQRVPFLKDKYIVGDFVTGRVWALGLPDDASKPAQAEELGVFQHAFSSFARSPSGEVYALDFARGLILQILPL